MVRCTSAKVFLALACVAVLLCLVSAASAVPAWDAFKDAQFSGITLSQAFESGVTSYTLTIDSDATVTVGANAVAGYAAGTYDVKWLQAFCVVSKDGTKMFSADGGVQNGWDFDAKPVHNGVNVAGWSGSSDKIFPSDTPVTFTFTSLNLGNPATPVTLGLHAIFGNSDGQQYSDFVKQTPPVPEPSSIFALLTGTVGMAGFVIRRKK